MSLLAAGGLGYLTSKGPFQPKAFYDSMIPICSNVSPKLKFSFSWEYLDLVKPSARASENLQEDRSAFSVIPTAVDHCMPRWETEILNSKCLLL